MVNLKKSFLFEKHICPWWLAYSWDHRLRRLIHNPEKILKPYVSEGDTVDDVGCGMGFFSFALASIVGSSGHVYSVDVQPKMLDVIGKRMGKYGFDLPITTILSKDVNHSIKAPIDFLLTFWMLHEVDDKESFLNFWKDHLKTGGNYLLVEPIIHISRNAFDEEKPRSPADRHPTT